MILKLKGVPPSLNRFNGRQNQWEYRAVKAEWTQRVWAMAKQGRVREPLEKAVVTITYYFPDARRRDPDNYCGKLLLDGLTKAGVIKDDDFNHITLVLRGAVDHQDPRTEVEVKKDE